MLNDRPLLIGSLSVVAAACMFSILGPLSRFAYDVGLEPLPFVAWRAGVGAIALAVLVAGASTRGRAVVRRAALDRRSVGTLAVASLMVLLLNLAMFAAFQRAPIAIVLLAFYTFPAMVAGVAFATGREQMTGVKLLALAIAMAGTTLVVVGNVGGGEALGDGSGILLALGAAACQTVYITVSRRGFATVPADQAVTVMLVASLVGCAAIAVATGTGEALVLPFRQPEILPLLLVAGLVGAAMPSLLFLMGVRRIGSVRAGILALFEPVVGVALAALLLAEAISLVQGIGGAGILAAALMLQLSGNRRGGAEQAPLPAATHEAAEQQ
jgi:drug/metabolite transporter, DME family